MSFCNYATVVEYSIPTSHIVNSHSVNDLDEVGVDKVSKVGVGIDNVGIGKN